MWPLYVSGIKIVNFESMKKLTWWQPTKFRSGNRQVLNPFLHVGNVTVVHNLPWICPCLSHLDTLPANNRCSIRVGGRIFDSGMLTPYHNNQYSGFKGKGDIEQGIVNCLQVLMHIIGASQINSSVVVNAIYHFIVRKSPLLTCFVLFKGSYKGAYFCLN